MKLDLSRYNEAQREAVCHKEGPALVLAGPGSGKTAVLTERLLYLVEEQSIPPSQIMVVTFTKAAAAEMKRRFEVKAGHALPVTFGTFHSIFFQILREASSQHSLQVLSINEKRDLLVSVLKHFHITDKLQDTFMKEMAAIKAVSCLPSDYVSHIPGITVSQILEVMDCYKQSCIAMGKLDFDDMAYDCLSLLRKNPSILEYYRSRFRYFLIDEFQDINEIQMTIMELLSKPHDNLFMVGDDDQAIYRFRGAGSDNMLSLPKRFHNLKQIRLTVNYRCREAIIHAAEEVIGDNKMRFSKNQIAGNLGTDVNDNPFILKKLYSQSQALFTVEEVIREALSDASIESIALLSRRRVDGDAYEALFLERKIPYERGQQNKQQSLSFLKEDIASYIHLMAGDRQEETVLAVLNKPNRHLHREDLFLHDFERDEGAKLQMFLQQVTAGGRGSLYMKIMYIRKVIGYDRYIAEKYADHALEKKLVLKVLDTLHCQARTYSDFDEWMALASFDEQAADKGVCSKCVQMMTYHASKGLEFDLVILPEIIDGVVPSKKAKTDEEIEEERRMFYVAMTRAKKKLVITTIDNKKTDEKPSVFLKKLL